MTAKWWGVFAIGVTSAAVLARASTRTGATREEAHKRRPGDDIVGTPTTIWNRGVTIHAKAVEIWPWLVQMGYGRGGFYAPWWIDQVVWRVPSPNRYRLISEYAHIAEGDVLADGPEYLAYWRVKIVEPERALVLWTLRHPWHGARIDPRRAGVLEQRERVLMSGRLYIECSWGFYLDEQPSGHTRLLVRTRGLTSPSWLRYLPYGLADAYISYSMLRTIKRLAESSQRMPRGPNASTRQLSPKVGDRAVAAGAAHA